MTVAASWVQVILQKKAYDFLPVELALLFDILAERWRLYPPDSVVRQGSQDCAEFTEIPPQRLLKN